VALATLPSLAEQGFSAAVEAAKRLPRREEVHLRGRL